MQIQAYLHFDGCCEEAIEFYCQALGARSEMLMRYRDNPEPPPPGMVPAGFEDKVMHASLRIDDSTLMLSDDCRATPGRFDGFQLTLSVADLAAAERRFAALGEGGKVTMPLAKTFFSPAFGMLVDRFGVPWMVIVAAPGQ